MLTLSACAGAADCPDTGASCVGWCTASFAGNFAETSTSSECVSVSPAFDLQVPSTTLGGRLDMSLDLGSSPSAGTYSSETVRTWSASGARGSGDGVCAYAAGDAAVPNGSFTLELSALDLSTGAAHGAVHLVAFVEAGVDTDCGPGETETVDVNF